MDSKSEILGNRPTLLEEASVWLREFPAEFAQGWRALPNKGFFLALLTVWILLFQFLGNATFGYIDSSSLLAWMKNAYDNSDGQDSHGFFIPFVVLALFWWKPKRSQLLALPYRIWWPALILLAGAVALHLVGYVVQQPRVSIVAMFAGIYALMGLAWGPGWLRASFFPFFLFVFCIPIASIGESVTLPLRNLVAAIVKALCDNNFVGMDIQRDGTQLFNSARTFQYEVAAACSGLRSLVAVFALATIYGFMNFEKNWKRAVMMLAAFPLAVLGNVLRLLVIIITADIAGQDAGNYVHESAVFNLLPYIPAMFGVVLLGHWLRESTPADPPLPLTVKPV
jgi:exosortase